MAHRRHRRSSGRRRGRNPIYLAGNPRKRRGYGRRSRNPGLPDIGDTAKKGLSTVATVGVQLFAHRALFGVERGGLPGALFNLAAGFGASYALQKAGVISRGTGQGIENASIFVAALPFAQQAAAALPGPERPLLAGTALGRAVVAANRTASRLDGGRMGRAVIGANRTASRLDGAISSQNAAKHLHGAIVSHRLPQT